MRPVHFERFLAGKPRSIDWVEALTENYLRWENGFLPQNALKLEKIRALVPVAMHGVSLSIGSADPLRQDYLVRLKELADRIEPIVISDHLCWTGIHGRSTHDLLPFPFTHLFLNWVSDRIDQVQNFLGREILIENVSSYVDFEQSEMSEGEFLAALVRRSGCGLLLDINNVYVSSQNHHFDPDTYLSHIPAESVGQIHLAGHLRQPDLIIDTHDNFVDPAVWKLFDQWSRTRGRQSAMIEWDSSIPEWKVLEKEVKKARKIHEASITKSKRIGRDTPMAAAVL